MNNKNESNLISREQANVLKGIAIISVILSHGNGFSRSFVNIPVLKDGFITSIFCQGGMCLFLILSGYGLFLSFQSNGMDNFWEKRFVKIFLPAILAQSIWFVIMKSVEFIKYRDLSIDYPTLFGDLTCTNAVNGIDGSIWYMSYLLFCYISFYLFMKLFRKTKTAVVAMTIFWALTMPVMTLVWDCSFYCVAAFIIGIWLAILSKPIKNLLQHLWVRIALIVVFSAVVVYYYTVFRQSKIFDNIASELLAFVILMLVCLCSCEKTKVMRFIGRHSFAMYLFQGKVIFGWFPYDQNSDNVRLIAFVILFLLDILVAVVFDKVVDVIKKVLEK